MISSMGLGLSHIWNGNNPFMFETTKQYFYGDHWLDSQFEETQKAMVPSRRSHQSPTYRILHLGPNLDCHVVFQQSKLFVKNKHAIQT